MNIITLFCPIDDFFLASEKVNVISALIAYQLLKNKPSLKFSELQGNNDLPMLSKP